MSKTLADGLQGLVLLLAYCFLTQFLIQDNRPLLPNLILYFNLQFTKIKLVPPEGENEIIKYDHFI